MNGARLDIGVVRDTERVWQEYKVAPIADWKIEANVPDKQTSGRSSMLVVPNSDKRL